MISNLAISIVAKAATGINSVLATAKVTAMNISLALLQRGGNGSFSPNSSSGIVSEIAKFYQFVKPILDILVGLLVVWGIYKVVTKQLQGEEGAMKIALIVVGGLIMWFFILPEFMLAISPDLTTN